MSGKFLLPTAVTVVWRGFYYLELFYATRDRYINVTFQFLLRLSIVGLTMLSLKNDDMSSPVNFYVVNKYNNKSEKILETLLWFDVTNKILASF